MFAAERTSIHRTIASAFEAKDAPPELLADHWRRAGDLRAAAAYAERAGDAALAIGAYGSARDRYCDVLDNATDDAHEAAIACKLAQACGALGDTATACSHLADAIAHYRSAGNDVVVAELECAYSDVAYRCGDVTGAIDAARRVVESSASRAEDRFNAHVSLATYFAYRPDVPLARAEIALADALVEGRHIAQELRLEWARATVALETSQDDSWRAPAEASLAMAERYGDPRILAMTMMDFAAMARECGRPDLARPALARAIDVADANGLVFASAHARCEAIEELYAFGRLDEAHAKIREVVGLQVHAPIVRVFLAVVATPVVVDLGIADRFPMVTDRSLLETAFKMGEHARFAALAAAFAYEDAMADRIEDARALIGRALDGLQTTRYISGALLVFARFGTLDHVRAVRQLCEAERERRANRPYRALVEAIHERSSVDGSRGRSAAARAIALAESEGFPLLEAFGHELASNLKDAVARYERCGAIAHVRRLTPQRGALTKREREVASALREGHSNRAIAERLVLSERTVENHVAAIYAKAGVKTRSEFMRASLAMAAE
jgi:DNA-binding CsgD family transcriptional regulator/tetratricopeptide (TPR) repeat protein